ncbi:hypothetical protein [Actinomadura fibrosa]|uniref:Uncharacterized protein n=1 Tax=Actinomadura fibrosa TaxID=111802 RepID=A0ABW2Y0Z5_9ACTN|nr:hypothetical protein [Actinomadura fibrosa]
MHLDPEDDRSRSSSHPLAATLFALAVLLLIAAVVAVAATRPDDRPQTTFHESEAPPHQDTRFLPASKACERDVVQALIRTYRAARGGGSADMAVAEERDRLGEVPYQAYAYAMNDLQMAEETGRRPDLTAQIQAVMPDVRHICSQES